MQRYFLEYDRKYKQFYWTIKCIINAIRNHTTSVDSCAERYPVKVQSYVFRYQRETVLLYDHNLIKNPIYIGFAHYPFQAKHDSMIMIQLHVSTEEINEYCREWIRWLHCIPPI